MKSNIPVVISLGMVFSPSCPGLFSFLCFVPTIISKYAVHSLISIGMYLFVLFVFCYDILLSCWAWETLVFMYINDITVLRAIDI